MADEFVILRHSGYGPVHYDLMLRAGDMLATWQVLGNPAEMQPGDELEATRLPDHRLAYLEYEGSVSRNRGRVERIERGTFQPLGDNPPARQFRIEGQQMTGAFELRAPLDGDRWRLLRLG
jgi:hypothetical protein